MGVAIRCLRKDCKFNKGGWCDLDYIEVNEKGRCIEYEPKKEISKIRSDL